MSTLSRFNFSCILDNQVPHGHPPASAFPKGLHHVTDETCHVNSGNKLDSNCLTKVLEEVLLIDLIAVSITQHLFRIEIQMACMQQNHRNQAFT